VTTLRDIGEEGAIAQFLKYTGRRDAGIIQGPGDDCAVVRAAGNEDCDWLLTSDPVIEGTHFDAGAPLAAVGHKAVGRALSDIAAMGGEPRWALINVVAPSRTMISALDAAYEGASALADKHGLAIVGGDISRGQALELHVFAVGVAPAGLAILRSGAKPGDLIFVTGALGGSLAKKHLSFEPRVKQGTWLRGWANSMIDLSDGLASDLRHIVTMSAVGAKLNATAIPVSPAAAAMTDSLTPLEHALYDGEDFELLFTVPEEKRKVFASSWGKAFDLPCTCIGVVTDNRDLIEYATGSGKKTTLETSGYRHFQDQDTENGN